MEFKPLYLTDKIIFDEFLKANSKVFGVSEGSELNFANLYAWKDDDKLEIYISVNFLVIKGVNRGKIYFLPPLAKSFDDFIKAINFIRKYTNSIEHLLFIYSTPIEIINKIKPYLLKDNFLVFPNRDLAEYIYEAEGFITLSGKKMHAKRNFVNRFRALYDYEARKYTKSDFDELINNLKKWDEKRYDDDEINAITSVLNNLEQLDAECFIIKVDRKIVAFTIWARSAVNKDLVYTLFEKGNLEYEGVFQAINNFNAQANFSEFKFINRQEDMGIPNLRKAKLSYPVHHLDMKYTIIDKLLFDELKDLYKMTFNETDKYTSFLFDHLNYHQFEYLENKKEIVSSLFEVEKQISYFKQIIPSILIVGVLTKETYRNQGKCNILFDKTLNNLAKQGIPFVYLYPVDHEFYKRYGFNLINYLDSPKDLGEEILGSIKEIYEKETANHLIYQVRTDEDYDFLNCKIKALDGNVSIHENGYVISSSDSIEEVISYSSKKELGMMGRILDIKHMLMYYPFDHFDNNFNIKITDELIEKNNCTLKLSFNERLIIEETCDIPDLTLDIKELTSLIFLGSEETNGFKSLFIKQNPLIVDKY